MHCKTLYFENIMFFSREVVMHIFDWSPTHESQRRQSGRNAKKKPQRLQLNKAQAERAADPLKFLGTCAIKRKRSEHPVSGVTDLFLLTKGIPFEPG